MARARGFSRFVGRAGEMETLDAALAQAQAGNGQVVGIVAEAGTGKSRLCFEFLERCPETGNADHMRTCILSTPIDWDLVRQQYDQMIKYTTVLRLGTAETEAIPRRFTKQNLLPPAPAASPPDCFDQPH